MKYLTNFSNAIMQNGNFFACLGYYLCIGVFPTKLFFEWRYLSRMTAI